MPRAGCPHCDKVGAQTVDDEPFLQCASAYCPSLRSVQVFAVGEFEVLACGLVAASPRSPVAHPRRTIHHDLANLAATLDPHAVQALLEHPALTPTENNGTTTVSRSNWKPLGVFAVGGAVRQPTDGGKSAGPLTPHLIHASHNAFK